MPNLHLLRHHRAYRHLWAARTISSFGDAMATTALILYAYQVGVGSTAVGLVLLAQTLPRLCGPLAGSLVDRLDQRWLLIGCDLGQALLFGLLAWGVPPLAGLLLITCGTLVATLGMPAGRSALPALVGSRDLPAANALLSVGFNASLALGPAGGALLARLVGIHGVLLIDALTFILSAMLLRGVPALPPDPTTNPARPSLFAATRAGIAYMAQHPTARAVAIGLFLVVVFAALDNVALVFLAQDVFQMQATGYGLLASAFGIGMVLGPAALLPWSTRIGPAMLLLLGVALVGLGTLCTAGAPMAAIALATQALVGIGNGLQNIANDTLIQRTVPRAFLGRVFGTVYSAAWVASSLAYTAAGLLLNLTSPRLVMSIAGVGVLVALCVLWGILPRAQPMQPIREG